jgi:hypothetical protein
VVCQILAISDKCVRFVNILRVRPGWWDRRSVTLGVRCVTTIGEFILARVDDDEFLAERMVRARVGAEHHTGDVTGLGTWDPRRVLASCAARRQLVLTHRVGGSTRALTACGCGRPGASCPPCQTLRALALEWSGHPDYQAEWRGHPIPRQARTA